MKFFIWAIPGIFLSLVVYVQLFLNLPDKAALIHQRPPAVAQPEKEVFVPTFKIQPLQHYRIDNEILGLFQKNNILTYGRINPMHFKPLATEEPPAKPEKKPEETTVKETFKKHSILPVSGKYFSLSSNFGWRKDPFTEKFTFHDGIDIAVPEGKDVFSVLGGTVEAVSEDEVSGLHIIIDHGGYKTYYMHLKEAKVKQGDAVRPGSIIGITGNTGHTTGPHLHFELRIAGTPVDPMDYLIFHIQ